MAATLTEPNESAFVRLRIINGDLRFHERQEFGREEDRRQEYRSSGVQEFRSQEVRESGERKGLLVEVNGELVESTANAEKFA